MSRHCDLFTGARGYGWRVDLRRRADVNRTDVCGYRRLGGFKDAAASFSKARIHFMLMKMTIIQDGRQEGAPPNAHVPAVT